MRFMISAFFFGLADDLDDVVLALADARSGDVVVVLGFHPIFDRHAFRDGRLDGAEVKNIAVFHGERTVGPRSMAMRAGGTGTVATLESMASSSWSRTK